MLEQGDLTSAPVEWTKPEYWDLANLERELRRQYDVCNSCRLCFNLCPAFPTLFKHFDAHEVDHDPAKLSTGQLHEFVDLCYSCKLCFIKCPYTPPHKFQIDIPRLVLRARAVEEKRNGIDLRERLLSDPDGIGPLASLAAPIVNWLNRNRLNRVFLEKVLGIHRDKILPQFAAETFKRWFRKSKRATEIGKSAQGESSPRVVLFHTCMINFNEPGIGRASVAVLEKNAVNVTDPEGQSCCGMPYLDSGRVEKALEHFRDNVKVLLPYVREGYDVVVPEPTCGMMLKKEYADYLEGDERAQANEISNRVFDICEYLVKLNSEGRLSKDFVASPGSLAYHQPCHLKYQAIGQKSVELLRLAGAKVTVIDKGCSGHDGTWAMKKEFFDLSQKVAKGLHSVVRESKAGVIATDCSLAGVQIEQGTGRHTEHPIEIVARAYGIDFSKNF